MAKRKNPVKTTYPSQERLASISTSKELNKALKEMAAEFGINSASWAARRAINLYMRLKVLDALLHKVKPEHIPQLKEALAEIVGEGE
jgi:hypothetical protein